MSFTGIVHALCGLMDCYNRGLVMHENFVFSDDEKRSRCLHEPGQRTIHGWEFGFYKG
jgi:hypothetical protein